MDHSGYASNPTIKITPKPAVSETAVQMKAKAQISVAHFAGSELLEQIEREALREGLEFINELVFENGAIYQGYLKDGYRHGPGL